jgi:hypothetical protein
LSDVQVEAGKLLPLADPNRRKPGSFGSTFADEQVLFQFCPLRFNHTAR